MCEDLTIAESAANGTLNLEKLEAMTAVCSVGLDMVAIPGDTTAEMISAIIADEMAIGVINKKTTAARLIPAPGQKSWVILSVLVVYWVKARLWLSIWVVRKTALFA